MDEVNLLQTLGQVSASQTGQIFREFLRGHVRAMIREVMATEVTQLCGPKHSRSEGDHYRAGSSPGRVLYEGEREEITRPRVRRGCGKKQAASSSPSVVHMAEDVRRSASQHQFNFNQALSGDKPFQKSECPCGGLHFNVTNEVFQNLEQLGQLLVGHFFAQCNLRPDCIIECESRCLNTLRDLSQNELRLADQITGEVRRAVVLLDIGMTADHQDLA